MSPTLICESVERALLTKCQIVSVLSFSLTTWWRLCLARENDSQKKGGTNGKFHSIVSFDFFLSDYKSLYIGADVCFQKR